MQPVISTPRLLLRPFALSDCTEVQQLAGDRAIADNTAHVPHPYLDGMAAAWISTHESQFQKREAVTFAITKASDQVLIGAISLMGISLRHQAELGYWIGKPYWGFGYCTEAARALLNFAFETLDLERVHCSHFSRNPASGAVMKKLGMNHEGTRLKHLSKWGILEDQELYGVVKADWKFRKTK